MFYIKGVLDGDGYIDYGNKTPRLALDVKSSIFANKFTERLIGLGLRPYTNKRRRIRKNFNGYTFKSNHFIVRATCDEQILNRLQNLQPLTVKQKKQYIEGLCDSEGYYRYFPSNRSHSFILRNKNISLLKTAKIYLSEINIRSSIYDYKKQTAASLEIHFHKDIKLLKDNINSIIFKGK